MRDERPDDANQFHSYDDWAANMWHFWENRNRFAISPIRRTHAVGVWPQDRRDRYAALFSPDAFGSLPDFLAYEFFHSSLLQTVVRDSPADGSWFVLESQSDYVERLCGTLAHMERFTGNIEVLKWLRMWELPNELAWLHELEYEESLVREEEEDTDVNFWSRTKQGYLVLLVING